MNGFFYLSYSINFTDITNFSILIKDILARIYFIYGMLLFAITMIPVAVVIFLFKTFASENTFSKAVQYSFQIWMGIYMPMIFCPVKHVGRHHFLKGKNYVVTLNHIL